MRPAMRVSLLLAACTATTGAPDLPLDTGSDGSDASGGGTDPGGETDPAVDTDVGTHTDRVGDSDPPGPTDSTADSGDSTPPPDTDPPTDSMDSEPEVDSPADTGGSGETDASGADTDDTAGGPTDGPASWTGGFVDATAATWATGTWAATYAPGPRLQLAQPVDLDDDGVDEVVAWDLVDTRSSTPEQLLVLVHDPTTGAWQVDAARSTALRAGGVRGAWAMLDLDDDGDLDVVEAGGRNVSFLRLGDGAGRFDRAPVSLRTDWTVPAWASLGLADHDHDGWLDLLLAQDDCSAPLPVLTVLTRDGAGTWVERIPEGDLGATVGPRVVAELPLGVDPHPVTLVAGGRCGGFTQGPGFLRWDGLDAQSRPRVRATDLVPADAYFRLTPAGVGASVNRINPMGAAVADFDANGLLELMISTSDVTQLFLEEAAQAPLRERSADFALDFPKTVGTTEGEAWGAAPVDLDRDGWTDLVVAQSDDAVAVSVDPATRHSILRAFWNDRHGGFVDVSARLGLDAAQGNFQTVAARDLDGDGDTDLVVGGYGFLPRVWRNELEVPGHALRLDLRGTTSDHLAIGARVVVERASGPAQTRMVGDAFGVALAHEPRLELGLGGDDEATRVTITWPSGLVQVLEHLAAGRHTLVEPETLSVDLPTRQAPADGATCVGVRLTPRTPGGAPTADASATLEQVYGSATWDGPATWDGVSWHRCLVAPTQAGSSVVQATLGGRVVSVRPRVWWGPP